MPCTRPAGAHGRTHGSTHGTTHAATQTTSNPHNETYEDAPGPLRTNIGADDAIGHFPAFGPSRPCVDAGSHVIGRPMGVASRRLITATISAPSPSHQPIFSHYPCNPARLQRPDRFYPALRLPWHSHYHPRPALACLCYSHAISTCFPSLRCAELTIWAKKRDEAKWLSEGFCTADL